MNQFLIHNVITDFLTMEAQLLQYFSKNSIQLNSQLSLARNICSIIDQKQAIISNLSQQITRYKCESIKNEKLIKSLQDKVNQLAPNICNTGSSFMMSSQFKTNFQDFMTTVLPSALGWSIDKPYLFSKCSQDIFTQIYTNIEQQLNQIISQICDSLKLTHSKTQQQNDLQFKIKLSLLKVFQEFWQTILPIKDDVKYEYIDKEGIIQNQILDEINEGLSNEDYAEMMKQLHKLCIYMILQQKAWEFVDINKGQIVKYSKKDHTCIDGWIKQGDEALLILGGIKKQGHMHPNLKNYVIPIIQDENSQSYKRISYKVKENTKIPMPTKLLTKLEKSLSPPLENSEQIIVDNDVEMFPLMPVFAQQAELISKNKSIQLFNKENYPYVLNKKSKKKDKLKFSMDTSLNLPEKSPKNRLRKHDESIKNKKIEIQQIEQRIYQIRDDSRAKKKSLVISKNINQCNIIETLIPLKQKNLEDLPVSKQINQKRKIKANTSRKNSVGKIVNQNHMINHDKENTQNINNSKMKNKEKVYKDIIKEKLLQDKIQDKTQHSLNILYPKSRADREKKKQENRPLKIQNNANKLRQKYIF